MADSTERDNKDDLQEYFKCVEQTEEIIRGVVQKVIFKMWENFETQMIKDELTTKEICKN